MSRSHIIIYEYVAVAPVLGVIRKLLLQARGYTRIAATFLLGMAPLSHLTFSHCGVPSAPHPPARDRPARTGHRLRPARPSGKRQEATMEIKTRLNVLATMMSFVFLAAIVFGMI